MQKVGSLKYSAPNINVYVLMIFTAFSLKSWGALVPPDPPILPPMRCELENYSGAVALVVYMCIRVQVCVAAVDEAKCQPINSWRDEDQEVGKV